jgi:hypothetical protein
MCIMVMQSFNLLKALQKNATRDVYCGRILKLSESERPNLFLITPENGELCRAVHLNTGILFLDIFSDAKPFTVFRNDWNSKSLQSVSPILAFTLKGSKPRGNTPGFQTVNIPGGG